MQYQVMVLFGLNKDYSKKFLFDSQEEAKAFQYGIEESAGYLEAEILSLEPVK